MHDMECYDPATNTWEVVLRVDRGLKLPMLQAKAGKKSLDANIVDALIQDFEQQELFRQVQSSGVQGYPGDAQRCMHLAGML